MNHFFAGREYISLVNISALTAVRAFISSRETSPRQKFYAEFFSPFTSCTNLDDSLHERDEFSLRVNF